MLKKMSFPVLPLRRPVNSIVRMEVITISAQAVFPLLGFMMIGYFFRKKNFLDESSTKQLNLICFRFFLSLTCAETIYKADIRQIAEPLPIIIVSCSIVITFLVAWLIVPRFVKQTDQIPVMIQGIYKANYTLVGLSVAKSICGENNVGMVSLITVLLVPINNVLSVYIFERYTGNKGSSTPLIIRILKNPLVLGSLIGLALNLSGIEIPKWIMTGFIAKLSALTTPLSMIALGASFNFSKVPLYKTKIAWAVFAKLVLVPMFVLPVAILLGVRGASLIAVAIYAVSPNAVNSFNTAVAMGGDGDLANEIVVMSAIVSILTMFGWFLLIGYTVGFTV